MQAKPEAHSKLHHGNEPSPDALNCVTLDMKILTAGSIGLHRVFFCAKTKLSHANQKI